MICGISRFNLNNQQRALVFVWLFETTLRPSAPIYFARPPANKTLSDLIDVANGLPRHDKRARWTDSSAGSSLSPALFNAISLGFIFSVSANVPLFAEVHVAYLQREYLRRNFK